MVFYGLPLLKAGNRLLPKYIIDEAKKDSGLTKGRPPVPKRLFFIKLIKEGVGVISVYKNLCCKFCIVQEAFLQQKWT